MSKNLFLHTINVFQFRGFENIRVAIIICVGAFSAVRVRCVVNCYILQAINL